jgi:hypothetical protein
VASQRFFVFSLVANMAEKSRKTASRRAGAGHALSASAPRVRFGRRLHGRGGLHLTTLIFLPSLLVASEIGVETSGFQRIFFAPNIKLPLAFRQQMLLISRASFEKRPQTACFWASTM